MRHLKFSEQPNYPIAFLVSTIRKDEILREYVDAYDIPTDDVIVFDLHYAQTKKKTPAVEMKRFITEELVPTLTSLGTKYIVVADSEYFKVLTKVSKTEVNLGYVLDCAYGNFKVVYVPNYRTIFYDPDKVRQKIKQGINALLKHIDGSYSHPGNDIIKFEAYPQTDAEIQVWLDKLLEMNCDLTIDTENFSLKHHKSGIGTITFCWSKHEGISFPVDYVPIPHATCAPWGKEVRNEPRRKMLRKFFKKFMQKAIYHSIHYDVYILIYQLFMSDILDTEGLLEGMDILLRNWEDVKLIAYLATNSCAGNRLSLKDQAQEFSGNYAQSEIEDITRIPLLTLLRYNLIDGLSTWYVCEKHYDTMVADQQFDLYTGLFKSAIKDIIQMQLTGLPLNMKRVIEVKDILEHDEQTAITTMQQSKIVQQFTHRLNEKWIIKRNSELKVKRVTLADAQEVFNPNSNTQLQDLLYGVLGLPVLTWTDSKQPSTDRDTITALVNHTNDPDTKAFLLALIDYSCVKNILGTFIPAMMDAGLGPDGWHYMFGSFNLGGTVSGRLSSSDPNLQNLPATGSKYAKLIKSCFQAPPGWIFTGLDFNSLEDKISAVTTKDPNKIKVYTDGYDGHSLRAFAYFRDQMPDIIDTIASINSIQTKYKNQRQDSKSPTFALTYQGTFKTLMTNCGFTEAQARNIEARYHELYKVSDGWVQDKLNIASQVGYVTVAFGMRVRTPLLKQVVRGNSKTPYEAEAEGRTAGNALGQSWCLLNSRASTEFMGKVRTSEHRLNIKPCAHIHDAQYMLVKDQIDAILYVNEHLVKAVEWQEHPDIANDDVKLGGELSIFWPDWAHEITIPNHATEEDVFTIIKKHLPS